MVALARNTKREEIEISNFKDIEMYNNEKESIVRVSFVDGYLVINGAYKISIEPSASNQVIIRF